MTTRSLRGVSAVECLVTMAIMTLLMTIVLPNLTRASQRLAVRALSLRLLNLLDEARLNAQTMETTTAVRFYVADGAWQCALVVDGNGNGVRNAEIAAGVDHVIGLPQRLFTGTGFEPGIVAGVPSIDTGAPLTKSIPAVNFNQSSLCSFSPAGSATPGTLYIAHRCGMIAAIRSSGSTGDIYALFYDPVSKTWSR